jgi:hypothetical protein
MAFEVNTYSPSEVLFEVAGYQISGFKAITVSRNSPSFTIIKGIRGRNSRIRNRDSSCTITVDLIQTSIINDVLTQLHQEDIRTNAGRFNLDLTDQLGSSKIVSKDSFIESYPELVYSDSIEYRRWSFICLTTDYYTVGGNG